MEPVTQALDSRERRPQSFGLPPLARAHLPRVRHVLARTPNPVPAHVGPIRDDVHEAAAAWNHITSWHPSLRLLVAVATIAIVVGMAVSVANVVAEELRATATEAALRNVETIVRGYVDPTANEGSLALGAPAFDDIDRQLERVIAAGDIRRVNIWSRDGRVVYSTDTTLRGRRFSIDESLSVAFGGTSVSQYESPQDDQETDNPLAGEYLEIYVPIRGTSDGVPVGVYEVYQDATSIEDRVVATRQDVFFIALIASSVLVLVVLLAYAGASRLLNRQNRLLRLRAATEQLLMTDVRRSEERFRSLIRNASDCILSARADTTVAFESPAVARVLGYAPEARVGRPAFPQVHPEDTAMVVHLFADVTGTPDAQTTAQFRVMHADGSWRYLEAVSKNLLEDAAVRGIVVNYATSPTGANWKSSCVTRHSTTH